MASKTTTKPHLFLSLNLLYFILSATSAATSDPPSASPPLKPPTGGSITVPIGNGGSVTVTNPRNGGGSVTVTNPPNSGGGVVASPIGSGGGGARTGKCPRDVVKLGVCANVVGDLVKVVVGDPPAAACCSLVAGLVDLEAAVCLCTVVRATVAGIDVGTPLNLLLDVCGRTLPIGFTC